MSSVEFASTCIGPTAGDLVPGSRRVIKKKKKKKPSPILRDPLLKWSHWSLLGIASLHLPFEYWTDTSP